MTASEENYLKTIYHLSAPALTAVNTNAVADAMDTKASSVTDMLKKLAEKKMVNYVKYQGVGLTEAGQLAAKMIVRKHRLWEVFLVEKLKFTWDEVHDIAEQLEHIKSEKLINKLDNYLGNPTQDPHGDPIPNAEGKILKTDKQLLSTLNIEQNAICVGVKDSSAAFLKYLDKQNILLGSQIEIIDKEEFDGTIKVKIKQKELLISKKIANLIYIRVV